MRRCVRRDLAAGSPDQATKRNTQCGPQPWTQHHDQPHQRTGRVDGKRRNQQRDGTRRDQGASQVVEHLPPAKRRQPTAQAQYPGKQLPVTAHPAMRTRRSHLGVRRKILKQLDVRHQAAAGEQSFEKVMAQHRIDRNAITEHRLPGTDVVESLAGEQPLAKYILVEVGERGGVGVHAAAAGGDLPIQRTLFGSRQQGRNARLQHAVTLDHLALRNGNHRTD